MTPDADLDAEIGQTESGVVASAPSTPGFQMPERLQITMNFGLWYLISAYYNIYNKKALNSLGLPVLVATIQMGTGILLFVPGWLMKFREAPFNSTAEFKQILWQLKSVASFTTLSHIAGVVALGSGTVSFTQVVKSAEPVFTAFMAAVFTRQFLSWQSYLSLIPVICGVSAVSASELTFSWFCLAAGMTANVFAAARSVFGKVQMGGGGVKKMSSENYYSVITILSLIMLLPITAFMEGGRVLEVIGTLRSGGELAATYRQGLLHSFYSGFLFYMYNELSFKVLGKVNPVTHAIANTVKRVVIILSSVLVFRNPLTMQGKIGSAITILGLLIYSLSEYYTKQKKQ
eukprot:CAMPEP_0175024106 /NCGR_PEP_ID=MMETSP0005-20121125/16255_1 /TAXON_ID=420556 /ORGANISM="Ochromonas sp., Strain CCMP1393" /LENGTH=345 /DNA_ID=CAMNT_0016282567 /DNA_START=208 /DNA_END=1245 /DNA_ORIENTATION=-